MPMVHDGGSVITPIIAFHSVAPIPAGGGAGGGGEAPTEIVTQTGTVEQAVAAAAEVVKQIKVGLPIIGNLPANAQAGQMCTFASDPSTIYVFGSDNIWRALVLVPVG